MTPPIEVVLYIDTSWSYCGNCGKGCDPHEERHDRLCGYSVPPGATGCHARYTHVSSHYTGDEIKAAAQHMRPDLPWKPRMSGDTP